MRRYLRPFAASAVVVTALVAISGCGGDKGQPASKSSPKLTSPSSTSVEAEKKPQPFTVEESAYTLISNTTDAGTYYVEWAAVLRNPNVAHYGAFPTVTVTALDKAGSVL